MELEINFSIIPFPMQTLFKMGKTKLSWLQYVLKYDSTDQ